MLRRSDRYVERIVRKFLVDIWLYSLLLDRFRRMLRREPGFYDCVRTFSDNSSSQSDTHCMCCLHSLPVLGSYEAQA